MKTLVWLALLALPLTTLLVPAASAEPVCIGRNPRGECIVGADIMPAAQLQWCYYLLLNPPIPGAYFYTAGCTPDVCRIPEIQCP